MSTTDMAMSSASATEANDQAAGLRQLFGPIEAPVHVLCCPARPALTLPLIESIGKEMIERQHTALWVDEIEFNEREQWPLPCKVKFDLSKTLLGHVDLDQTVSPLQAGFWYGLSLHTARIEAPTAPLTDRLNNSGVQFDTVMVASMAHKTESFAHYGSRVHCTALTHCNEASLRQALTWFQQSHAHSAVASFSVVLMGQPESFATAKAWLQTTAASELAHTPKVLGEIDKSVLDASLSAAWTRLPELCKTLASHLLVH